MYSEGEIVRVGDLLDPKTSGTLSLLLSKVRRNLILIRPASPSLPALLQDHLVLTTLLKVWVVYMLRIYIYILGVWYTWINAKFFMFVKERAVEVVKHLGESHWTGSCIVTMGRFQDICGGPGEASAVLSHLSETGKARYLSVRRKEFIEVVAYPCWSFVLNFQWASGEIMFKFFLRLLFGGKAYRVWCFCLRMCDYVVKFCRV